MTFCKVFFLYSDSVIEFHLQKSIYNYYSLKFVQRHGYKSQEWFKFLFVWWKKIPHSSRAAVVPKQTFLSTSRYFFKTHCVFLELLTPLFVDLSFCNSTPHWDHTGQISILKVHLEVFFPLIKSQLDGWKNICVDIHNNQQFWIQEDGLEYTIFTNLFVMNYPHSEHFSTSSPEFSTFLGYHRGFKKCRHLRELQHFPQSCHPAASLVLHLWAVSNFLALKIPYQILGVFLPYQSWYFVDRSNSTYLQHSIVYYTYLGI